MSDGTKAVLILGLATVVWLGWIARLVRRRFPKRERKRTHND